MKSIYVRLGMPHYQVTRFVLPVMAVFMVCAPCQAQSEAGLEKVRVQYEQGRQRLKQNLSAEFRSVIDRISKSKENPETKVVLLEVVKTELARFEKSSLIPWSTLMLPYSDAYLTQLRAAQNKVIAAYNAEIDKYMRKRDDGKATSLRAELKSVLGIEVVARWNHSVNNGSPIQLSFYSNGRVDSIESKTTWSLEGGRLLIRGPNPNAPGGAWVDNCAVSLDGLTYSGRNQARMQIGGHYIKP